MTNPAGKGRVLANSYGFIDPGGGFKGDGKANVLGTVTITATDAGFYIGGGFLYPKVDFWCDQVHSGMREWSDQRRVIHRDRKTRSPIPRSRVPRSRVPKSRVPKSRAPRLRAPGPDPRSPSPRRRCSSLSVWAYCLSGVGTHNNYARARHPIVYRKSKPHFSNMIVYRCHEEPSPTTGQVW